MTDRAKVTLRDILYVGFKYRRSILTIAITATVVAALYAFIATPRYCAESKLLVKMGKEQISALEDYRKESYNILFQERSQHINNEIEILNSEELQRKVFPALQQRLEASELLPDKSLLGIGRTLVGGAMHLASRVVQWPLGLLGLTRRLSAEDELRCALRAALDVEYMEDTDILRVSFAWPDPRFAAFALNTITTEFLALRSRVHKSPESYQFYVDQSALYARKLATIEQELQSFVSDGKIANIEVQKKLLLERIADLDQQLHSAALQLEQAQVKLQQVRDMHARPGVWIETPDIGSDVTDKQAYLRDLDKAYFALMLQRQKLLKRYAPQSREITTIDTQTRDLREQKAASLLNILEIERETAETTTRSLEQEVTQLRGQLDTLNSLTFGLQQRERERQIVSENYLLYTKKAEDLRIFDDLDRRQITSVKIINTARPPLYPEAPKKLLIILVAAFLGLATGFCYAAIGEYFNHTFRDEAEAVATLRAPLLMTVPLVGSRRQPGRATGTRWWRRRTGLAILLIGLSGLVALCLAVTGGPPAQQAPTAADDTVHVEQPAPYLAQRAPQLFAGERFTVQVCALRNGARAAELCQGLQQRGLPAFVMPCQGRAQVPALYRVRIGPFATRALARQALTRIDAPAARPLVLVDRRPAPSVRLAQAGGVCSRQARNVIYQ